MCRGVSLNKTAEWKERETSAQQALIDTALRQIWEQYNQDGTDYAIDASILDGNWANAGTWFPTLARVNGAFMDAFQNHPRMERYPLVMEQVREERRRPGTAGDRTCPSSSRSLSRSSCLSISSYLQGVVGGMVGRG